MSDNSKLAETNPRILWEGFYSSYRPRNLENQIDKEYLDKRQTSSLEKLNQIRERFYMAIGAKEISNVIINAVVDREIEDYEYLREQLNMAMDIPGENRNYAWRVLNQEETLLQLERLNVISLTARAELEKKYPSLKAKFAELDKAKLAKIPAPLIGPEAFVLAKTKEVKPVPVPTVTTASVIKRPTPEKRSEVDEPWQKIPAALELNTELAKELEKCSAEVRKLAKLIFEATTGQTEDIIYQLEKKIPRIDFKRSIAAFIKNSKVRNAGLLTLLAVGTAGFTNSTQTGELRQNVQEIMLNASNETAKALSEFRAVLESRVSPDVPVGMPITIPKSQTPFPAPAQAKIIGSEKTEIEPVVIGSPESAIPLEEIVSNFRLAHSPEPPPGFKLMVTPPESNYNRYVQPNYKSKSGSPYLKGLDYGQFSWGG